MLFDILLSSRNVPKEQPSHTAAYNTQLEACSVSFSNPHPLFMANKNIKIKCFGNIFWILLISEPTYTWPCERRYHSTWLHILRVNSTVGRSEQPNCFSASLWSESKCSWMDLQQRGSGLESGSLSPSIAVCLAPDRSTRSQSWTGNRTKLDQRGIWEGELFVSQLDIIGEWDLEITCNRITVMQGDQTAPPSHPHWMHV